MLGISFSDTLVQEGGLICEKGGQRSRVVSHARVVS